MRKTLADITDHELETAYEKAWQRFRLFGAELNRRKLIEEYGSEKPDLNEYNLSITISCPLTVQAASREDAERLVVDWVCVSDERYGQIGYDDTPEIEVDEIEEMITA